MGWCLSGLMSYWYDYWLIEQLELIKVPYGNGIWGPVVVWKEG